MLTSNLDTFGYLKKPGVTEKAGEMISTTNLSVRDLK